MLSLPLFLRYWYLWLVAFVLAIAAISGFRETLSIPFDTFTFAVPCWAIILTCAIVLAIVALVYQHLDLRQQILRPRWYKPLHLGVSLAFSILIFVYLQILLNRRFENALAYFEENYKHRESVSDFILLFPGLFLLTQLGFIVNFLRFRLKSNSQTGS